MAGDSEEIKKIKKQLEDLKGSFGKDLQNSIDQIIKRLSSGSTSLNEWKTQLTLFQTQADKVSEVLDYVSRSLSDSVNELKKGDEFLRKQVNSTRKLSSIADQLLSIRKGEASFDKKKINNLKDQQKLHIQNLQSLLSQQKAGSDMAKSLQRDINAATELNEGFEGIEETASNINKKLGILPQAAKGIDKAFSKLGLGNLGIADAVDETHKLGQEAARVGDKGFKPMSTFVGNLTGKLGESLTKVNLIQFALMGIVDALMATDTGAADMAKSMNLTYSEALETRKELTGIANASYDSAVNTKGLQESLLAVNDAVGARVDLDSKDLVTMTKMREQAGMTNEESIGLLKLSQLNGKSLEQNNVAILGAAKAYAGKNKLAINEKQILKDVAKISASLKLSLGGSAEKMAEAAIKARQFGLNLEQAEKMSSSLLDFESSIESELSAELLTGKDLNFERARGLALNGDTAAAAAEIAKQVGSSADFAKMNVIQQEAIAKAAGLTKDELAQSLIDRESLAKLGAKEGQSAQDRYNELKAQGMSEAEIAQKLGSAENARMYEQQGIQERFNQTVEKLKEIFMGVANALMPIFDIFSSIFDIVGPIVGLIGKLVSFMSPLLKPILLILGAFKGIKLLTSGTVALNNILIAQNAKKLASNTAQVAAEGTKLTLGQSILATLGLQDAVLTYQLAKESGLNTFTALRLAMEETILGSLILQGVNLLKNVGQYVYLTLQSGYRAVAESAILGSLIAQGGAIIKNIAKGAIYLAQQIATSIAQISGSAALSFGATALIALAAGAAAYAFFNSIKGDDIMSPGGSGGGYGSRTLLGPEGAIQLNNKDTVIAGTNLFDGASKGDDVMSGPKGAISVSNSTAPKKEVKQDPNAGTNARLDALISATGKVNSISTLKIQ